MYAYLDSLSGRDSSPVIESDLDVTSQLHYAGRHSELRAKEILKPVKSRKLDFLAGDIADITYRPHEILGEDITTPVLDAYAKYRDLIAGESAAKLTDIDVHEKEAKLTPEELADIREESGLLDAIEDAREEIQDRFEGDADGDDRIRYGLNWLDMEIGGSGRRLNQVEESIGKAQSNVNINLLRNNIPAAVQNATQLAGTTIPEYGVRATWKGVNDYRKAVKEKSPELEGLGGTKVTDKSSRWDKYDLFQMPEHYNQGVTYFTVKAKAIADGESVAEAKRMGQKAIEDLQFKNRPGNRPAYYWKNTGFSRLGMLSFSIQMRRLHHSWYRGMRDAVKAKDGKAFAKNAKAAAYFYVANTIINGATANIPEEMGWLLKTFTPELYKDIRQIDQFSILGAMGADRAEISRIPISPVGFIGKVPLFFDKLGAAAEVADNAFNHPSPKNFIKLAKATAFFVPPAGLVGNKNIGNAAEYLYRSIAGDYDRTNYEGEKIRTDNPSELRRAVMGSSVAENIGKGAGSKAGGAGKVKMPKLPRLPKLPKVAGQ